MTDPWLTVVTVVKDDPDGMRRTGESLAGQDLTGVQYVVIDSSADRAIVPRIVEELGLSAIIEWRPPEGVYAAMNIALDMADGRYVFFANAGDTLHADVLAPVRAALSSEPVFAFGRLDVRLANGRIIHEPEWDYDAERKRLFARRLCPSHQALFMRLDELRRQGGFDLSYRVSADMVAIFKASLQGRPVELGITLGTFEVGGVSTTDWPTGLREFRRARREVYRPTGWTAILERLDSAENWLRVNAYFRLKARPHRVARPR